MRKIIFIASFFSIVCLSHAPMIVNDPLMQAQQLMNYFSEVEVQIRQETMQAEELKMMLEEYADKLKAKDEDMKKRIRRIEKSLTLYKEIRGCHQALDRLRRNLLYSQYLSLTEKYTIYSRAQIICYDIVTRISDIAQLVNEQTSKKDGRE